MGIKILFDSGFWMAWGSPNDPYHDKAVDFYNKHKDALYLIPYPSMYEFLNTKFCKNPIKFSEFCSVIERKQALDEVQFLDDTYYRKDLLKIMLNDRIIKKNTEISAVDIVIREMSKDLHGFILVTVDRGLAGMCYHIAKQVVCFRE